MSAPVGLGVVGLGTAGAMMVRAAARHPGVRLAACADPQVAPREAFARDFNARAYPDLVPMLEDPEVEAVYIATPHQLHAQQAVLAAARGKHVVVEKPLALTLADCDAVIAAAELHGVAVIVGHTHAFDPNVRAMRRIIASGGIGRVGMIASWNYTNYLYRPRRPEELDTAQGGGIVFNQIPHQIDIARTLGGGRVRSVRAMLGALDPSRPTEGNSAVLMAFENGAAASLVYSGYDFFDSDELHFWVSEAGTDKPPGGHGAARRALAARSAPETALRAARGYSEGAALRESQPHLPHFGILLVTGESGELRASADGVLLYDADGVREIAVPRGASWAGHGDVLDALCARLREGRPCPADARWGKANVEAMLAVLRSAREQREIALEHQVALPEGL
ncbi:MAG TPA: Gfo/Idh/MocA family oxidoreductase [Stellaceae bacterium]|nr:Gfo/Idh/MocA family oxidoreductase [Stellaceae bacterium]